MRSASIRIPGSVFDQARDLLFASSPQESVAFISAIHFSVGDQLVLLAQTVIPAKPGDYLDKSEFHLEISPLYVSRVLNLAEDLNGTVIMVHSHPFEDGTPRYSPTDDSGERRTSRTISDCLEGSPPVGSLLFGRRHISARVWMRSSDASLPADATVIHPTRYEIYSKSRSAGSNRHIVDRQVRAIGPTTQSRLEALRIGIVGLGGTGSNVAEQLVRMGISRFTLVDFDKFDPSNWSRLYGSTWKDTARGVPKVSLIDSHLRRINPKVECSLVAKSVLRKEVLQELATCDLIFSCLDRHGPRAVLNELSYQCLVPVVDVGVGITSVGRGPLLGSARATIIGPGFPCLFCQELVRPDLITAENLSPREYAARRAEGYVAELTDGAPSVIAYTTLASSLGLTLLIDYIRGEAFGFSTILFDLGTKEVFKLSVPQRDDCICRKRLGRGFQIPFSVAD